MVYLCGRPLRNRGRCTLGRETAIQRMTWSADGWLRTEDGQGSRAVDGRAPHPRCRRTRFAPDPHPRRLRWSAAADRVSVAAVAVAGRALQPDGAPGPLRLYGRETIGSQFRQALVARRQQSHCFSAATVVEFEPRHFQQMAGLVCYYNSAKFHYLYVSHDEAIGKHLRVMTCLPDQVQSDVFTPPLAIPAAVACTCESRWTTSGSTLPIRSRAATGSGCRSSSTRASCPTRRRRPGSRISPARSSAWRVRTSPGRPCRPTSTTSSISERDYRPIPFRKARPA